MIALAWCAAVGFIVVVQGAPRLRNPIESHNCVDPTAIGYSETVQNRTLRTREDVFLKPIIGLSPWYTRRSSIFWAGYQLLRFVYVLILALLWGLLRAITRRQFHWSAFLFGVAPVAVLLPALHTFVFFNLDRLEGQHSIVLFAGIVIVMTLSGGVIGWVGRRVGYYECYLLAITAGILGGLHLAVGWPQILGLGPSAAESYFDSYAARPPGARYFGDMWVRTSVLCLSASFLMSLVGSSLAYLFRAERLHGERGAAFEWRISMRHLMGNDRSAAVSLTAVVAVVGVALGVAALVTVTSVMSGYQADVRDRILSTNAHLVVQKYGQDFAEYDEIEKAVVALPGIEAASPFTFNEAMLSTGERAFTVLLKGIDATSAAQVTGIAENLCASVDSGRCERFPRESNGSAGRRALVGSIESADELPSLLVGSVLYDKIGLHLGDVVTLSTPVGLAGARGNAPKRMRFRLRRVFSSGMYEFDSRLAYTSLDAGQKLMGMGDAVTGVEVRVSEPGRVEQAAARVLRGIGRYPYRTLDWRKLNEGIFRALSLQKIVYFLVLSFIIVVAAFNIASTLFMAVMEKSAEIGVLKSMGARDTSIMRIFVAEGWFVGGVGTVVGLVLGVVVCLILKAVDLQIAANVYMVDALSVRIRPVEVALTALAAMVISHLATLYPALKGAKQRPVDAIRYD